MKTIIVVFIAVVIIMSLTGCATEYYPPQKGEKQGAIKRKGFVFDGASIPRFFWRIIGHPLDHEFIRAVLLHDGLYASELLAQALSDEAFLEFMKYYDDIGWLKRNAMHKAVRVGGGSVWKDHTPESIKEARKYVSFINSQQKEQ